MPRSKQITTSISIICILLVLISSFFMPQFLVKNKLSSKLGSIQTAPDEYYQASKTALAQKASQMLSPLDKIALITGSINSTESESEYVNVAIKKSEAAELAKRQLEVLYNMDIYPCSLMSDYNNWYSYTVELHTYTDQDFDTYTANMLHITFTKYDGSITHEVLMTEDGAILTAVASQVSPILTKIDTVLTNDADTSIFTGEATIINAVSSATDLDLKRRIENVYPCITVDDIKKQFCYLVSFTSETDNKASYYIYQYTAANTYSIGLLPTTYTYTLTPANVPK